VFTDGQQEKSITIYLAVHSVHLADIKINQLIFFQQRYRHGAVNCLLIALCDVHDDIDSESARRITDRQTDRQTDGCILQ